MKFLSSRFSNTLLQISVNVLLLPNCTFKKYIPPRNKHLIRAVILKEKNDMFNFIASFPEKHKRLITSV